MHSEQLGKFGGRSLLALLAPLLEGSPLMIPKAQGLKYHPGEGAWFGEFLHLFCLRLIYSALKVCQIPLSGRVNFHKFSIFPGDSPSFVLSCSLFPDGSAVPLGSYRFTFGCTSRWRFVSWYNKLEASRPGCGCPGSCKSKGREENKCCHDPDVTPLFIHDVGTL